MKPALQLVDGEKDRIAPAEKVAAQQVANAQKLLTRDLSKAPRWAWRDLDVLTGPMLPGDLVVVGSLMGNGKSTLLMSQMDAFAAAGQPTLYFPLEVDPEVCRLGWAAWRHELPKQAVIRQDWSALPTGAERAVHLTLEEQKHNPMIHFATPKRVTLPKLLEWCQWARREFDAKVIMLDHLHRMDFGDGQNHRVSVTDAVRRLKDLARELGVVLIAAAQLNRSSDPIDAYSPPLLSRLKESAGIAEEADVVLMLSRRLRRDLPDGWQQDLRTGRITENDLADRGIMVVTCRKHRLDDAALNGRVLLSVRNGKVVG
jgi:replicative DNA helicase